MDLSTRVPSINFSNALNQPVDPVNDELSELQKKIIDLQIANQIEKETASRYKNTVDEQERSHELRKTQVELLLSWGMKLQKEQESYQKAMVVFQERVSGLVTKTEVLEQRIAIAEKDKNDAIQELEIAKKMADEEISTLTQELQKAFSTIQEQIQIIERLSAKKQSSPQNKN